MRKTEGHIEEAGMYTPIRRTNEFANNSNGESYTGTEETDKNKTCNLEKTYGCLRK